MPKFRIMPHGRLQEWVADEKGYFSDAGLDYEFVRQSPLGREVIGGNVQSADATTAPVLSGAFEAMEAGRACEVSSACHWAVNMASSADHGRMWGRAYSVTPGAVFVSKDSNVRTPDDLRDVAIGVGYHSGSHFSCLQALEPFIAPADVKLNFAGSPNDRLDLMVEGRMEAVNVFGIQKDVLENLGFRRVVDTSFMIGFLLKSDTEPEDAEAYFDALRRAQVDIDLEPERYKHHFLKEMPEKYRDRVDVRGFSAGERLVFEPYTREMYERTHRWMEQLSIFPQEQLGAANFEAAVVV